MMMMMMVIIIIIIIIIQEFVYRDTTNVEPEMYDCTSNNIIPLCYNCLQYSVQ